MTCNHLHEQQVRTEFLQMGTDCAVIRRKGEGLIDILAGAHFLLSPVTDNWSLLFHIEEVQVWIQWLLNFL